jgi:hypothetical protein
MGLVEPGSAIDWQLLLAIAERRLVHLLYDDLPRLGEVHDYGRLGVKDKANFFQLGGRSSSGNVHAWKTLDVTKIRQLQVLDATFAGSRPARTGEHLRWDEVYASVTPELMAKAGRQR